MPFATIVAIYSRLSIVKALDAWTKLSSIKSTKKSLLINLSIFSDGIFEIFLSSSSI